MQQKSFVISLLCASVFALISSCTPNPNVYTIARSTPVDKAPETLGDRAQDFIGGMGLKKWSEKDYTQFASEKQYIETFAEPAMKEMKRFGVPASITLAQGILETNAGKSNLVKEPNNHFGIKCHNTWKGKSVRHDDDAAAECFRKYKNPLDSYRDHSQFLSSRPRYASLFDLDPTDYKAWANGLRSAGYATDKAYADKLIRIIETYDLDQYDAEALGQRKRYLKRLSRKERLAEALKATKDKIAETTQRTKRMGAEAADQIADASRGLAHRVTPGDTLYSIAKKYEVTVEAIKKMNVLNSESLSIGQILEIPRSK